MLKDLVQVGAAWLLTVPGNPASSVFLPGEFDKYCVELFYNETYAMNSSTFAARCKTTNPCIMVTNSYNHTLGVWPELDAGKQIVKYVNDTTSKADDPWLYIPANRTILIPGPPVYKPYLAAMRAFPVHNRTGKGWEIEGRIDIITKIEWWSCEAAGNWTINISLVDGYNVGAQIELAGNRTLTTYIPSSKLKQICPKDHLIDSGNGNFSCKADCKVTGSEMDCCTGKYDDQSKCPPSSNFFIPYTNQSYHYAHDDKKIRWEARTGRVVKINFGPQNITDVPMIASPKWYEHELEIIIAEEKEKLAKKERGEKYEDSIEEEGILERSNTD